MRSSSPIGSPKTGDHHGICRDGFDGTKTGSYYLSFAVVKPAPLQPGDVNGDGKVDVRDATLALRIAVGLVDPAPEQRDAGDVNGDGVVNIQDATRILRQAVGLG